MMNTIIKSLKVMAGLVIKGVEKVSAKLKDNLTEEKQEMLVKKADETLEQAKQLGTKIINTTRDAGENAYEKIKQGISENKEKINQALDKLNNKIDELEKNENEEISFESEDSELSERSAEQAGDEALNKAAEQASEQETAEKAEEPVEIEPEEKSLDEHEANELVQEKLDSLLEQLSSLKEKLNRLDESQEKKH